MFQKNYYINESVAETGLFVKNYILQTNCKIISEDSRSILWTYSFGIETIECETTIKPQKNGTNVTTKSQSEDIEFLKAQKNINELYDALSKKFKVKEGKINTRKKSSNPKKKSKAVISTSNWFKIILGIIIVASSIIVLSKNDGQPQIYITNKGFYATSSKEDYDVFLTYINDKDKMAIDQLFNQARVVPLAPNREVFLVKSNWGYVKIRPKGATYELWVLREAIRPK